MNQAMNFKARRLSGELQVRARRLSGFQRELDLQKKQIEKVRGELRRKQNRFQTQSQRTKCELEADREELENDRLEFERHKLEMERNQRVEQLQRDLEHKQIQRKFERQHDEVDEAENRQNPQKTPRSKSKCSQAKNNRKSNRICKSHSKCRETRIERTPMVRESDRTECECHKIEIPKSAECEFIAMIKRKTQFENPQNTPCRPSRNQRKSSNSRESDHIGFQRQKREIEKAVEREFVRMMSIRNSGNTQTAQKSLTQQLKSLNAKCQKVNVTEQTVHGFGNRVSAQGQNRFNLRKWQIVDSNLKKRISDLTQEVGPCIRVRVYDMLLDAGCKVPETQ